MGTRASQCAHASHCLKDGTAFSELNLGTRLRGPAPTLAALLLVQRDIARQDQDIGLPMFERNVLGSHLQAGRWVSLIVSMEIGKKFGFANYFAWLFCQN